MRHQTEERKKTLIKQVEATPGANLRQLHRYTEIPLSTTSRLLDALEAEGAIRSEGNSATRHFYPAGTGLHARERIALRFVSKPRSRALVTTILDQPGIRHSELAAAVDLPPPTLTYYMKQFKAADIVLERRVGVEVYYRAKNTSLLRRALQKTRRGFDVERA